ncbi:DUF6204 family protein [Nocardioides pelophilus]|uniref:DUF6204 family protein n=1 Tax=Nocardioides pelophilus TaxID=2172019 RepID=UPI001600CA25|nr:DUF6204 family protein [Nocardioides pelophilus]
MNSDVFRVTVSGKFVHLTSQQRRDLVAGSDVALMSFSRPGTFTCDPTGTVFTFRCAVPADEAGDAPDSQEESVRALALAALAAHGYQVEVRRTTVVDMREIKIPRR